MNESTGTQMRMCTQTTIPTPHTNMCTDKQKCASQEEKYVAEPVVSQQVSMGKQ